jgi:hypothetical protein
MTAPAIDNLFPELSTAIPIFVKPDCNTTWADWVPITTLVGAVALVPPAIVTGVVATVGLVMPTSLPALTVWPPVGWGKFAGFCGTTGVTSNDMGPLFAIKLKAIKTMDLSLLWFVCLAMQ